MYHLVGIKGSGMSALALLLNDLGYKVQGSDVEKEFFTEIDLKETDIKILPFDKLNIKNNMVVIYGTTFKDHEEVLKAKELNLKIISYPEMLGALTRKYFTICVSGTHGKTTTSTMLKNVLESDIDLNYLIGDGSGKGKKNNKWFLLESCEYKRHFLKFFPYVSIITNIDLDHVDYYKNIDDLINSFQEFSNKTSKLIIACGDDENVLKLKSDKIKYYGIKAGNDIYASNIKYSKTHTRFDVYIDKAFFYRFKLPIYGKHMVLNCLAVIALANMLKIEPNKIQERLNYGKIPKRRFNIKEIGKNVIIDDYAHHPNEIEAVINAAKQKYPNKSIIAIFEPHTYSRTEQFKDKIIEALKISDKAYILPIYKSREQQQNYEGVTSDLLIEGLENSQLITKDNIKLLLENKESVFLFMSPNDLKDIEENLENLLKKKS